MPLILLGEVWIRVATLEKFHIPTGARYVHVLWSSSPIRGYVARRGEYTCPPKTLTRMFLAAFNSQNLNGVQRSANSRIGREMCYVHTTKSYSNRKEWTTDKHRTWLNLMDMMLSKEVRLNRVYVIWSYIYGILKKAGFVCGDEGRIVRMGTGDRGSCSWNRKLWNVGKPKNFF